MFAGIEGINNWLWGAGYKILNFVENSNQFLGYILFFGFFLLTQIVFFGQFFLIYKIVVFISDLVKKLTGDKHKIIYG